jgi:MFS family permease
MAVMNIVAPMVAISIFWEQGGIPDQRIVQMAWGAFLGTAVGRVAFGWLGDRVGRQPAYGWSTALMALSMLFAATTSFGSGAQRVPVTTHKSPVTLSTIRGHVVAINTTSH